jgi:hypothetical protein
LPLSLRRKLTFLGLSASEVRQALSFPFDAASLRQRNGYNSLSPYCKRPAGGDSFSGRVLDTFQLVCPRVHVVQKGHFIV